MIERLIDSCLANSAYSYARDMTKFMLLVQKAAYISQHYYMITKAISTLEAIVTPVILLKERKLLQGAFLLRFNVHRPPDAVASASFMSRF